MVLSFFFRSRKDGFEEEVEEEEEEEEEEERSVLMVNFPLSVIPFDRTDTRIAGSRYLISANDS